MVATSVRVEWISHWCITILVIHQYHLVGAPLSCHCNVYTFNALKSILKTSQQKSHQTSVTCLPAGQRVTRTKRSWVLIAFLVTSFILTFLVFTLSPAVCVPPQISAALAPYGHTWISPLSRLLHELRIRNWISLDPWISWLVPGHPIYGYPYGYNIYPYGFPCFETSAGPGYTSTKFMQWEL